MRPQDLIEGHCYFDVGYAPVEEFPLQIPSVDAIIFETIEKDEAGRTLWVFRGPCPENADIPSERSMTRRGCTQCMT